MILTHTKPACRTRRVSPATLIKAAAIVLIGAAIAPKANGLVVTGLQSLPAPSNGWIGNFNGCTGVCVGPDWLISARHVGGGVGSWFIMRGQAYQSVEVINHPYLDLALVRVDRRLPGYHPIAQSAGIGDPVILGGFGVTGQAALPDNAGYDWAGAKREMWGANVIEQEGFLFGVRFDAPGTAAAVPFESIFAVSDSGGGLFVVGDDDQLELAGVAVSVSGYGSARWGNAGFALNSSIWRTWAMPIVTPDIPISSAVEAPRAMLGFGGLPSFIALPLLALSLTQRVRRRQRTTA